MTRAVFALLLIMILNGCGGSVTNPSSTPSISDGITGEGSLAIAKLACRQYPNLVVTSKYELYLVSTYQYPPYPELQNAFVKSKFDISNLSVPSDSLLLSDLQAVSDALSSLHTQTTLTYRKSDLSGGIRAFNTADLAVSVDCQAIFQQ